MELEKTASRQISRVTSQDHINKLSNTALENGKSIYLYPVSGFLFFLNWDNACPFPTAGKLPSAGSLGRMEQSHFLQASLDSFDSVFSERRGSGEATMSPYFLKSMTPSAFEAALRQKDGELASYVARLVIIFVLSFILS